MELKKHNKLKVVSKIINERLKVDLIICFGEQTRQFVSKNLFQEAKSVKLRSYYHLLVITETNVNDVLKLQNEINDQLGSSRISILVHSGNEVISGLIENQRLFQTIFQKADKTYLKSKFQTLQVTPFFKTTPIPIQLWQEYHHQAVSLQRSAVKLLRTDDILAPLYLIRRSLEYGCIGLLECFLGYKPKHDDLAYLLPLCDAISNKLSDIFSITDTEDGIHFCLLSKNSMEESITEHLNDDPFVIFFLFRRCTDWLRTADHLVKSVQTI